MMKPLSKNWPRRWALVIAVVFCSQLTFILTHTVSAWQVVDSNTSNPTAAALSDDQRRFVDEAVTEEMAEQDLVGIAIGIIRDGEIEYLKGYGLANREANLPVTLETVFNWASNSKPVIAQLAAILVQEQCLDLDADIRTYLPNFPDKGHVITTRQLLNHQSGFPHYNNGTIIPGGKRGSVSDELDPDIALERFIDSPLIHKPGETYDYSSYAYVILTSVVQSSGKHPIADQLKQRIIEPLELNSFQLDVPLVDNADPRQHHWASGYRRNARGHIVEVKDTAHFWKHGAGGYKSNIQDFAKWAQALMSGNLVADHVQQEFWTPQATTSGEVTTYGLGFGVAGQCNRLRVSHSGSQDECKTMMVIYPNQKHGVVVLSNCNHAEPKKFVDAIYQALK